MSYGIVQVGRLPLREALSAFDDKVNATSGARTVSITGQESLPPLTLSRLAAFQDDIPALMNALVPVTFTDKADRDGYYEVRDVGAKLLSWNGEVITCDWNLTLQRLGSDTEVDLESRLSGATRNNSFAPTGERWHAPPIGHYGYWTGTTQASVVTRTGADGPMTVYRGVPAGVNPRWGCPVGSYLAGRVRFLDSNGLERVGTNYSVPASGWELSNGLVKVAPAPSGQGTLTVSAYSNGAWQAKQWDIQSGGTNLEPFDSITVLHNEPEMVVLRLLKSTTLGRRTVDLTLRRGSRFVELYLQRADAGTLGIKLHTTEAGTAASGYITATVDDAAGNRYIVGSAKTFTADAANGGISLSATTTMDAFIGAVVGPDTTYPNLGFEDANINDAWVGTSATIAVETGIKRSGDQSVKVTPGGTAVNPRIEGRKSVMPAVAGVSKHYVRAWVYSPAGWANGVNVGANFGTAGGGWLAAAMGPASPPLVAGAWTMVDAVVTAPNTAGIAWAQPRVQLAGAIPAATDIYYVDDVMIRPETPSGDTAAALHSQYLGAPSEMVQAVRR